MTNNFFNRETLWQWQNERCEQFFKLPEEEKRNRISLLLQLFLKLRKQFTNELVQAGFSICKDPDLKKQFGIRKTTLAISAKKKYQYEVESYEETIDEQLGFCTSLNSAYRTVLRRYQENLTTENIDEFYNDVLRLEVEIEKASKLQRKFEFEIIKKTSEENRLKFEKILAQHEARWKSELSLAGARAKAMSRTSIDLKSYDAIRKRVLAGLRASGINQAQAELKISTQKKLLFEANRLGIRVESDDI